MSKEDQEYLRCLAVELGAADRFGADADSPEGMRWIKMSDALATAITESLRAIAARMEARAHEDWRRDAESTEI